VKKRITKNVPSIGNYTTLDLSSSRLLSPKDSINFALKINQDSIVLNSKSRRSLESENLSSEGDEKIEVCP